MAFLKLGYHFLLIIFSISETYQQSPVVKTKYGEVRGFTTSKENITLTKFMGIPFAKPPVGTLRFMKPEKAENWSNIFEATRYSLACYSARKLPMDFDHILNVVTPEVEESEDCLFLNIFLPGKLEEVKKKPRAVMFWIHGGGWIEGNSNSYVADTLVAREDVIVVTSNYRVGFFGFMASDDGLIPGNVGLFDQHSALVWINENIAEFGGDASRITIFGESAGADSVFNHLVSPLSKNLFSRAIIQSTPNAKNRDSKEEQFAYVKTLSKDVCPFEGDTNKFLECMQGLSVEEVLTISDAGLTPGNLYDHVIIDGEFLPHDPTRLFHEGHFHRGVDIIVGFTGDDGDIILQFFSGKWEEMITSGLSVAEARQLTPLIIAMHFNSNTLPNMMLMENLLYQQYISCKNKPLDISRAVLDMTTDSVQISNSFEIVNTISKYGQNVYVYEFDYLLESYDTIMGRNSNMEFSAGHGHDLLFIFDYFDRFEALGHKITATDREVSSSIMKSFAEFAKTGKPRYLTKTGDAPWGPFTELSKEYLLFTGEMTEGSSQIVPETLQKNINLWNYVLNEIQVMDTCDPYFGASDVSNSGTNPIIGSLVNTVCMLVASIILAY